MKIITISGLDGSGKSTQIEMLKNYLESEGKKVFYFHAIQFGIANRISSLSCCHNKKSASKSNTKSGKLGILLRKVFLKIDICRFEKLVKKLLENAQIKQLTPELLLEDRTLYPLVMKLATEIPMSVEKKQAILAEDELGGAADALIHSLTVELNIIDLQRRIHGLVQTQISKNQREYYLNEQIKAINKELDELSDSGLSELEELEEKIRAAKMPLDAEEKALNEVKRLKSMPLPVRHVRW